MKRTLVGSTLEKRGTRAKAKKKGKARKTTSLFCDEFAIFWDINLSGTYTTQRIAWNKDSIEFWAIGGHYPINETVNILENWKFQPNDYMDLIPQENMRLHMNLWLVGGKPPSDGRPIEVVLAGLQYTEM